MGPGCGQLRSKHQQQHWQRDPPLHSERQQAGPLYRFGHQLGTFARLGVNSERRLFVYRFAFDAAVTLADADRHVLPSVQEPAPS